jgi:hypothetical protein
LGRELNLVNKFAPPRNIIQYQNNCARYDENLYYTLRPGTCIFENEEFETTVYVNSLGLRDDEISLENPKVIFLGDSHTMGWGGQQDETFPQMFEGRIGLRTLNGGISSYGTPRELMLLKKLNLDEVQYVFIQYSSNDIDENQAFFEDGPLNISGPEKYQEMREGHEEEQKYFLGKYSKIFTNLIWLKVFTKFGSNSGENKISADSNIEAKYFINTLEKMDLDHSGPKIIVFSIGIYNKNDPKFVNDLSALLKGSSLENLVSAVHVSHILNQDDYFIMDGHINDKGHKKIAQFLSDAYF